MDKGFVTGVVRNRKINATAIQSKARGSSFSGELDDTSKYTEISNFMNQYCCSFFLRIHKFQFEWVLSLHILLCIASILPFFFSGSVWAASIAFFLWCVYNGIFIFGSGHASTVVPDIGRLKRTFTTAMHELMPKRLLPVMSLSFLLVIITMTITGVKLGGPPLCYSSCRTCLNLWSNAIAKQDYLMFQADKQGCGYTNGVELLSAYTITQSSFLPYVCVLMGLVICLGWRISDEEWAEHRSASEWLKKENPGAYKLREDICDECGKPGSSTRPLDTDLSWLACGFVAATSFTVLGWNTWSKVHPGFSTTILFVSNVMLIFVSTYILHVGFYGRILVLYQRNLNRVEKLTTMLFDIPMSNLAEWWNCRNFVLQEDLSLDYDVGGLAVSATFLTACLAFSVFLIQLYSEGFHAILSAPASYCAYSSLYVTICLIRIFSFATKTYEEQQRHIEGLHLKSLDLLKNAEIDGHSSVEIGKIVSGATMADTSHVNLPRPTFYRSSSSPALSSIQTLHPLNTSPSMVALNIGKIPLSSRAESAYGNFDNFSNGTDEQSPASVLEGQCREIADIVLLIRKYDPYPCIFGIPVMPGLFKISKFVIYILFILFGSRIFSLLMKHAVQDVSAMK